MNDIPHGTTSVQLFNAVMALSYWNGRAENSTGLHQPQVQFSCSITESRLDDELNVAVLEFTDTPHWLCQDYLDPYAFPRKITLGTLWKGVNLTNRDAHGQTEFIRAATDDNLLYAETLAEFHDTEINAQDSQDQTALHWACAKRLPSIVRLCLSVPGCDLGLRDQDHLTAFAIAKANNDEELTGLFYNSMLELDAYDPQEALLRILTVTAESGTEQQLIFPGEALFQPIEERNSALVKALLTRGVDLSTRNENGDTALHLAAAQADNADVARGLLAAGADINAVGSGGATALHRAVCADREMVEVLLEWRPDLAVKDWNDNTALQVAAVNGQQEVERILVDFGCDATVQCVPRLLSSPIALADQIQKLAVMVERNEEAEVRSTGEKRSVRQMSPPETKAGGWAAMAVDSDLDAALHLAATGGYTETVIELLAKGANIEAEHLGAITTPKLAAGSELAAPVSRILARRGQLEPTTALAKIKEGHDVSSNGHNKWRTIMLDSGTNIEMENTCGKMTALHLAASQGHTETVTALLARGANLEAVTSFDRMTALHLAASHGHSKTVTALLEIGAEMEAVNQDGWRALHLAVRGGSVGTAAALLQNGADIEAHTGGVTSFQLASTAGNTEMVEYLTASGVLNDLRKKLGLKVDNKHQSHGSSAIEPGS